eukprot:6204984-Pleurochrysis_carterae.AAC.1
MDQSSHQHAVSDLDSHKGERQRKEAGVAATGGPASASAAIKAHSILQSQHLKQIWKGIMMPPKSRHFLWDSDGDGAGALVALVRSQDWSSSSARARPRPW